MNKIREEKEDMIDISEEEKRKISSLIAQGYTDVPPNTWKCPLCGVLTYFKNPPQKYTIYECTNCKTMFFIDNISNHNDERGTITYRRIPDKNKDKVLDILKKNREKNKK